MKKELIFIDLINDKYLFCNLFLEKKGESYEVIEHSGKLGNKGVKKILYSDRGYKACKDKFWLRVNEKKFEKYRDKNDLLKIFEVQLDGNMFECDNCGKPIEEKLYYKIIRYLGKKEIPEELKNKVICLDCQKKFNIYEGISSSDE